MTKSSPFHQPPLTASERRAGPDRRSPPTFPPRFSPYRRRRSAGRREADEAGYVDIYNPASWAVAISILALSLLDALFTVFHLELGLAQEANPLMKTVLQYGGNYGFVSVKVAMTAFPLAIIVLHKEWRLARFAARIILVSYAILTSYHLYLLFVF